MVRRSRTPARASEDDASRSDGNVKTRHAVPIA